MEITYKVKVLHMRALNVHFKSRNKANKCRYVKGVYHLQAVSIVSPSTTALWHRKLASAVTNRDILHTEGHCQTPCWIIIIIIIIIQRITDL